MWCSHRSDILSLCHVQLSEASHRFSWEEIKQGCENQDTGVIGGHIGDCLPQTLKLECCSRVITSRVEGVRPLCHPIEPSLDVGCPRKGYDLGWVGFLLMRQFDNCELSADNPLVLNEGSRSHSYPVCSQQDLLRISPLFTDKDVKVTPCQVHTLIGN